MHKFLFFIAGAAIGSTSTYFIIKKKLEKKYQKFADDQINSVKNSMREYYSNSANDKERETDKPSVNLDARQEFQENDRDVRQVKVDYSNIKSSKRPSNLPPTAIDTPDGYPDIEDTTVPPYLIREEDFGDVFSDICEYVLWSDGTLTYDDARCEELDLSVISDQLPTGWQNMFGWDKKTGKYDNVLYFRNNKTCCEIQIIKRTESYHEWLENTFGDGNYDDNDLDNYSGDSDYNYL